MRVERAVNDRAGEPLPRGLFAAAPLSAVFVLLLNDHVLKGAQVLPGWLTGKLSDVAGLFFFPVLLVELAGRLDARRRTARAAYVAALTTALVFAATKTSAPLAALASALLGKVVRDPTDLVALPACALSAWWMTRTRDTRDTRDTREPREPRRLGELVAMLSAAFASLATSAIHYPPCHEPPKPIHRVALEKTCVQSEGAHVTLQGTSARAVLVLRATTPCRIDARALALELDFDGGHGIVRAEAKGAVMVEQDVTLELPMTLPYPARCAGLVAYFELDTPDSYIDVPIAGCTEGT